MNKPNAIIVDTNVLIHDPGSIDILREDNILILPSVVLYELDNLKSRMDIGIDAREAIRRIEELQILKDPSLIIFKKPDFNKLEHLDQNNPDHHIIATAYNIKHSKNNFKNVKIVSQDTSVRIISRELNLIVQDYLKDKTEVKDKFEIKRINVPVSIINDDFTFIYNDNELNINENDGVICLSDWNGDFKSSLISNCSWKESFVAIKKGDIFKIVPNDINAFGIKPFTTNGFGPNWEQFIALSQLMDDDIKLIFLQGGTGSGKTLLALAAALEQRRKFRNILITRPMIHLEDEDRMGFLPGDIDQKMDPWLRPIWRCLSFLGQDHEKEITINKLKESQKIGIEPLDYIRGMTYVKDILIIDEAQNLTPHQIKTIITRSGEGSKMIFTGDLGQVDRRRRLDEKSNGLSYASTRMKNNKLVANSYFRKTVRSELAHLADKLL